MHWMRRHARGRPPHPDVLTPAEWRVLAHLREGLTNAEIAERTGLARNTVKHHVSSMLAKTGLADREALARWQGTPAPASRLALARERSPLLAPLAWLRAHGRGAGIGAGVALGAAALVAFAAAMPRMLDGGGEAAATATPTAVAAATVEPTPALAATPFPDHATMGRAVRSHPGETPLSGLIGDDGWPTGAAGPLVVYSRLVSVDKVQVRSTVGPDWDDRIDTREYVIFDLGTRQQVSLFTIRAARGPGVQVRGTRLFANYYDELWVYALDGSGGRMLIGGGEDRREIERFVPNGDGTLVAAVHFRQNTDHVDLVLEVIDVATGDVTFRVTQEEATSAGLMGELGVDDWSADGGTLGIYGSAHKEHTPHIGTLTLDGAFRFFAPDFDYYQWAEPLGERPTPRMWFPWCDAKWEVPTSRIEIIHFPTGELLNAVEDEWPVLMVWDSSPDGREILYRRFEVRPELGAALAEAEAARECPFFLDDLYQRVTESLVTLHVLSADGGPPIEVASEREVYERWFGERLVTFACRDEEVVGRAAQTIEGWWPNHTISPDFKGEGCNYDIPIELRVGGQPAGSGVQLFVLGFVERP